MIARYLSVCVLLGFLSGQDSIDMYLNNHVTIEVVTAMNLINEPIPDSYFLTLSFDLDLEFCEMYDTYTSENYSYFSPSTPKRAVYQYAFIFFIYDLASKASNNIDDEKKSLLKYKLYDIKDCKDNKYKLVSKWSEYTPAFAISYDLYINDQEVIVETFFEYLFSHSYEKCCGN